MSMKIKLLFFCENIGKANLSKKLLVNEVVDVINVKIRENIETLRSLCIQMVLQVCSCSRSIFKKKIGSCRGWI